MFGHLGAETGEQERKMRQMIDKVGFLEAWRGGGGDASRAEDLGTPPPKKHPRGGVGAPTSSWRLQPGTS